MSLKTVRKYSAARPEVAQTKKGVSFRSRVRSVALLVLARGLLSSLTRSRTHSDGVHVGAC